MKNASSALPFLLALFLAAPALAQEPPVPATAPSAGALLESGIYQEETVGDLTAAAKIYQQVLSDAQSNRPYAAQAAYRLAMIQFKQKKTEDAIATLTRLKSDYPDQRDIIAKADAQLTQAGVITKTAVSAADRTAARDLAAQAWKLWGQRKLPEAEDLFRQAADKDPTNANTWNGLGWAQLNQGKKEDARIAFQKAVALDPKAAASWNGLGWIAKGEGKTDDAIADWQNAYDAAPTATAAISGLASTYAESGDYDKAILWYNRLLKADPQNADAKSGLETATLAQTLVRAATPAAESWLKLNDDAKFADAWDAASPVVQGVMTKDQWISTMKALREPLGKVLSRKLISGTCKNELPGAPDGKYVILQFQTDFENKKSAVETITPAFSSDGKWQISGYYIK